MGSFTVYHWLIVLALVVATRWLAKFMQKKIFAEKTAGQRRLERIGLVISLLWVGSCLWFGDLVKRGSLNSNFAIGAAVSGCALTGLALLGWYYRYLREADELVRKMETEAFAFGMGLSTIGMVAAEQLERAGADFFVRASSSWMPGGLPVLLFIFGSGIARHFVYARYR